MFSSSSGIATVGYINIRAKKTSNLFDALTLLSGRTDGCNARRRIAAYERKGVNDMKIISAGDMLIQRRLPGAYDGFVSLRDFISQGDVRFFNLETTLHNGECFGSQYNGGSWLRADPESLEDARAFGFNMLTFANNHAMDFSHAGLVKTLEACKRYGFPNSGCGRNLDEAAAPAYLDTLAGRVALISVTASFNPAAMAGKQSRRVQGRPGVNGLRYHEKYYVSREELQQLDSIARKTDINAFDDDERAYGYQPPLPEGVVAFGHTLRFEEGSPARRETFCEEADMARVERAIYEAKLQAEYILVSVHSHELRGADIELPDHFLEQFCHACIDMGAHAVLGHGPHLLRPIEVYKGKPILYSLGDFVMQNENIPYAPEDFYENYGMTSDDTLHALFRRRSNDFTRGLQRDHRMLESVVALMTFDGDVLKELELLPIELGFGLPMSAVGWPKPDPEATFLERFQRLCDHYGTQLISKEDGRVFVKLS